MWKTYQCFERYGEMQKKIRRWKFWIELKNVLQKYDIDIGILLFFLFGVCGQSKTSQPNEKNIYL